MPTDSTYYDLKLYNATTDGSATFLTFRSDIAGTSASSNMNKLDLGLHNIQDQITVTNNTKQCIFVSASAVSANVYGASASSISAYTENLQIILAVDTSNTGAPTLNINILGAIPLAKVDATGTVSTLLSGDLIINREYIFRYTNTPPGSITASWMQVNSVDYDTMPLVTAGSSVSIYNFVSTNSPPMAAYVTDQEILLKIDQINAGAVGLNINGLGVRNLYKYNVSGSFMSIEEGDLLTNNEYIYRYNGTQWVWVNNNNFEGILGAIRNSSSQSVPNNAYTFLPTYNIVSYDSNTFHPVSSGSLVIPTGLGGIYLIGARGYWTGTSGSGKLRDLVIYNNGVSIAEVSSVQDMDSSPIHQTMTTIAGLDAGDILELYAKQISGSALNFNDYSFWIKKIM